MRGFYVVVFVVFILFFAGKVPCGDNEGVQRAKTSEYPYCWLFLDIHHISCTRKSDANFLWKNPKWH